MEPTSTQAEPETSPKWKPLAAIERRVVGVLVEKAKTTPDNYPLSLNALKNGCNQKSNRYPLMQVEEDHVEVALDDLREQGAVSEIQGGSRVSKYRHLMYDWLGVDKVELAVMAELLLRGAQTEGELRGRAARMEPINGLSELRPILDSLKSKGLIMYLTPEGRGSVLTHTLYRENELDKLRQQYGAAASPPAAPTPSPSLTPTPTQTTSPRDSAPAPAAPSPSATAVADAELDSLRRQMASLQSDWRETTEELQNTCAQLRSELDDIKRQLGVG